MKNKIPLFCFLYCVACKTPATDPVKVDHDGVYISYTINGKSDTTLLFLHGWCIDKSYWQKQVEYFSPRYKVVTMDLPGFGASGTNRTDWSVKAYGEDVITLIKSLQLQHVILIGHSMSGDIALETAVHYPDAIAGVVAIDNFKEARLPTEEEKTNMAQLLENMQEDYIETVNGMAQQGDLFSDETDSSVIKRVLTDFHYANPDIATASLTSLFSYSATELEQLEALPFKLYLLNCDASPTNEDALQQHTRNSYKLVPIHATSHYPMIEVPDTFNQQLDIILDSIAAG